MSGSHLLFHTVSSIVPSAAFVLTVVFGMGTGVTQKRITTGPRESTFSYQAIKPKCDSYYLSRSVRSMTYAHASPSGEL